MSSFPLKLLSEDVGMNEFYERFKSFGKEELMTIILNPADYQHDAVTAARQVIIDNRWTDELNQRLEELEKKQEEEQTAFEQEVIEKADYYRKVVEIKNERNSFFIRISHIPEFEAILAQRNIEFFREDKHIGPVIDTYPTQQYFFKHENVAEVDQIVRELGLITAPYYDIKPGFRVEIIIVVIAIAITILAVIFLS
jgi:hypothetical protein